VVATDIPEHVPDLAADMLLLDDGAETLPLDVTSEESVEAAVCRVMALHGRIDVLVNNCGIGCTGPLAELPAEAVRRAVDVNFLGQVRTVRAVAARGERGQRGRRRRHAVGRALLRVQGGGARGHGRAAAGAPAAGRARGEGGAGGWAAPTWRPWPGSRDGACTAASRRPSRSARASQTGRATDAGAFARHVARRVMSPRPDRVRPHDAALRRDAFFARRFGLHKNSKSLPMIQVRLFD
jgi:hypothetical protein